MQQQHIRIPPVVSISMIATAWRNSHTGCNLFQLLHGFLQVCLMWTPDHDKWVRHHDMVCPQVLDGVTASDMEGGCKHVE